MNINKEVNNIYKSNYEKEKNKVKAIKKIHEELSIFYLKLSKQHEDAELLLKRLADLEFSLNYSKNILISILFGIITSFIVNILDELSDLKLFENLDISHAQNKILAVLFIIGVIIIIVLIIAFILSAPAWIGLFVSYKWVTNKRDILLLHYEKDLIIDILKVKYEINYEYQPIGSIKPAKHK